MVYMVNHTSSLVVTTATSAIRGIVIAGRGVIIAALIIAGTAIAVVVPLVVRVLLPAAVSDERLWLVTGMWI
jgi:hypothetical protein